MLTKKQTVQSFKQTILPGIRDLEQGNGSVDWGRRQFAWTMYKDSLQRSGELGTRSTNWRDPDCVLAPWRR